MRVSADCNAHRHTHAGTTKTNCNKIRKNKNKRRRRSEREREREYAPSHAAAAIRKLQPAANSCEAAEAAAEAVVVAAGECEESVREECTMCVWCGGRRGGGGADITCSFVQKLIEFHKLLALSVPFMCDALSFR